MFTWWFTLLTLLLLLYGGNFRTALERGRQRYVEVLQLCRQELGGRGRVLGVCPVFMSVHETAPRRDLQALRRPCLRHGICLHLPRPCFYTDTTEGMVPAPPFERHPDFGRGRMDRIDNLRRRDPHLVGHSAGYPVHDFAYIVVLMTGIAAVLLNWNPLMKLDGYYMLCRFIGDPGSEGGVNGICLGLGKKVRLAPAGGSSRMFPSRRRLGFAVYASHLWHLQLHCALHRRAVRR